MNAIRPNSCLIRDYYRRFGVQRDADEATIKKAYRRLAMKHHPDRNPDDTESEAQFKAAKEAYEVLSDPHKRARYDQFGKDGLSGAAGGGFNPGDAFGDIFGDVFGDIFGGGAAVVVARNRAYRGADLRYGLELTLEQVVFGDEVKIRHPQAGSRVTNAMVRVPPPGARQKPVKPAMALDKSACSRVSSRCSRPAPNAAALAK